MKNTLICAGFVLSSVALAQNSGRSQETNSEISPESNSDEQNNNSPSPSKESPSPSKESPSSTKALQKPSNTTADPDKTVNSKPAAEGSSPYGASFSFGWLSLRESSDNLNSSGYARVEFYRKLKKRIPMFDRLEMGVNILGADIGGKMGTNGAYSGSVNSLGISISGYTALLGHWSPRTSAEFGIAKIKKIPSYDYAGAKTLLSYGPLISLHESIHYQVYEGLSMGPSLALSLGAVSGWSVGLQANFAY